MKLKTLIEVQRCFELLREAECVQKPLSSQDYIDCLTCWSTFKYELKKHIEAMPAVEVEAA